jgi:soluble lytic murein transglycosylase-like protein
MQLMPGTARRFGVRNIFDPAENIEAGVRYLRFLLDLFNGDVELALAAYKTGEGTVIKYGYHRHPRSITQRYVRSVLSLSEALKEAARTGSVPLDQERRVPPGEIAPSPASERSQ